MQDRAPAVAFRRIERPGAGGRWRLMFRSGPPNMESGLKSNHLGVWP